MSQSKYLLSKLKKFGLDKSKPRSTPCDLAGYDNLKFEIGNNLNFREMTGGLIYAMVCTCSIFKLGGAEVVTTSLRSYEYRSYYDETCIPVYSWNCKL